MGGVVCVYKPVFVGATRVARVLRRSGGEGAAGRVEKLAACAAPTAGIKRGGFLEKLATCVVLMELMVFITP